MPGRWFGPPGREHGGGLTGELAFGGNAIPLTIANSQLVALLAAETASSCCPLPVSGLEEPQTPRDDRKEHVSTMAHGTLFEVTAAACFAAPPQRNLVIVSEESFCRVANYQNGTPNTLNSPPTTGTWTVGDF